MKSFTAEIKEALKAAGDEIRLLGDENEEVIQRVRDVLAQSDHLVIQSLLAIEEEFDESDFAQGVQALILYRFIWDRSRETNLRPNEVAVLIKNLIAGVCEEACSMARENDNASRIIALKHGAKFAENLIQSLPVNISKSRRYLDEAECFHRVGRIYFSFKKYEDGIQHFQAAIRCFNDCLKDAAIESKHYCLTLWFLGHSYYRSDKFDEAEKYFLQLISEGKKSLSLDEYWITLAEGFLKLAGSNQKNAGNRSSGMLCVSWRPVESLYICRVESARCVPF